MCCRLLFYFVTSTKDTAFPLYLKVSFGQPARQESDNNCHKTLENHSIPCLQGIFSSSIMELQKCSLAHPNRVSKQNHNNNFEIKDIWLLTLDWICSCVVFKLYQVETLVSSSLWKGSMTGTDVEHTFMKTVLIQTIASERGISIWTPVLPQSLPASQFLLRASMLSSYPPPSFSNNAWDNLGQALNATSINEIYISVCKRMKK